MLQLKDLTIDFVNHEITVPSVAPKRSQASPNMCFSSHMNLLGTVIVQGNPVLMNMDTGDASYGSLDSGFFESNKEYITTNCKLDTIRTGGLVEYKPRNAIMYLIYRLDLEKNKSLCLK